jgi:hypothetical protein
MVDKRLLEKLGCTQARLREIFTCDKESDPNFKIRERFQDLIESRIHEGVFHSCKNHTLHLSVDLAWDSLPINKTTIPLLQYAQGKINIEQAATKLEGLGDETRDKFVEYNDEGHVKSINVLRLYEVSVNLIRSYITRRVAAQVSRFSNFYPYFKYEPRGTDSASKLRAEVLSQRVEIMAEQFEYRHTFSQVIRNMFMYGHSVVFPMESWTRDVQWREREDALGGDDKVESYVLREGVHFVNPHPTRVMWDHSSPLHNINSDLGPRWIGYWDIVRFSDVRENPAFWNMSDIQYTNTISDQVGRYRDFFDYYFDGTVLSMPRLKDDFAFGNERTSKIGIYTSEDEDKGMFLTNMFMRVNPKAEKIGDYPHDVWLKLVVASDNTVIFAEFLPSIPAIYGGINQNDDRVANCSMAHDLMAYQDQMNNIMYALLHHMKIGMMKILSIDEDALSDDEKEYIRQSLDEETFYAKPKAFYYSGSKMQDLGVNSQNFISVIDVQAELSQGINTSLQAVLQLLNLVERLLILSPQELGQAAPREISATEVSEIANTTNSIYSFISEGIDDMRSGVKKMLYEHLVSCSTTEFNVPVKGRYSADTVEAAGLDLDDTDDTDPMPRGRNIVGSPVNLVHEYLFSSRDGAERNRDTQSAQILTQLFQQVSSIPDVAAALGKERMFDMLNEIFRLSGAGYDLNLELDDGDQADVGMQREQFITQLQEIMPKVEQAIGALDQRVSQMEQSTATGAQSPSAMQQQGLPAPKEPVPVA